jgi:MFS family permease
VLALSIGLGAGLATMALPLAGLGVGGWRWLYAGGLLALPLIASAARRLPESRRFTAAPPGPDRNGAETPVSAGPDRNEAEARVPAVVGAAVAVGAAAPLEAPEAPAEPPMPAPAAVPRSRGAGSGVASPGGRLALLAVGSFLFALFSTPSSQFHNEFLRVNRSFSAARISAFSLITGTIGSLGVMVGGRLADVRGRRQVAAVGVAAGIVTTVASYAAHGWSLWAWGVAGCLLGYGVAPAIGVYGPELFPTSMRSWASGVIGILYAAGGVTGLVLTGVLSSAIGTMAPAFAILAIGPLALVVLIIVAYPETAGRELEEINPEDGAG